ncbi:MAG: SulP family inorganic anion transporter [Proteobacteria bacterium]|nr:SulP family inorganic anion transporter [Pseudomonadota bacterium]
MAIELFHGLHFRNLKGDIYGGITAAVVALPLALAFGVASGAGPVAGMYGAIFVGFFAALFGGTPAQVSGPTGPMTVVTAALITQYAHEPGMAFTVIMLAGLFQIGFGLMRLGRYINLVPYPVISGFMSGIGCIIIILQLAPFVGRVNPAGGPLQVLTALPQAFAAPVPGAVAVGLVSLVIAAFLPLRLRKFAPSPLVALGVGSLLAAWYFKAAPIIGNIPTGFPDPQLPTFGLQALPGMIKSALVLAFLGAIDSLLTSLICDNMTQAPHRSNRELIGQGIGNTIAGLMGAIPGAGATMRSVINIRAGGQTPLSGALHALMLLAVMLGLGAYASYIPHAVLAGILIKVGVDIIDWNYLKRVPSAPRAGVIVMFTVMGLTVFVDLITAVAAGVVMASLLLVKRMADLQLGSMRAVIGDTEETPLDEAEKRALASASGRVLLYAMSGPLSFGAASEMSRKLDGAGRYEVLVLDLSEVPFVDSSSALAIEGMILSARRRGRHVILVGLKGPVARVLVQLGVLRKLGPRGRFRSRVRALEHALKLLPASPGAG